MKCAHSNFFSELARHCHNNLSSQRRLVSQGGGPKRLFHSLTTLLTPMRAVQQMKTKPVNETCRLRTHYATSKSVRRTLSCWKKRCAPLLDECSYNTGYHQLRSCGGAALQYDAQPPSLIRLEGSPAETTDCTSSRGLEKSQRSPRYGPNGTRALSGRTLGRCVRASTTWHHWCGFCLPDQMVIGRTTASLGESRRSSGLPYSHFTSGAGTARDRRRNSPNSTGLVRECVRRHSSGARLDLLHW